LNEGNAEFVTQTIRTFTYAGAIVAMLVVCLSCAAMAANPSPLRVPDTSSPRATLQGFIKITDDLYTRWADLLTSYWDSGELYPTFDQRKLQADILNGVPNAVHPLDMSEVPPVELGIVGAERAVQLREILDRIDLPPMADVPDAAAMANQPAKRWRLPDTEIDFALVQQGPRAGEYLVSPETVERLPEFYQRVKDLPYKEGPARRMYDANHRFSPNSNRTIYDILAAPRSARVT
jgi:MscS family membrane protein